MADLNFDRHDIKAEIARNHERNTEEINRLLLEESGAAPIRPGAIRRIEIPEETLEGDPILSGEEIPAGGPGEIVRKFRRPNRRDWIQINPAVSVNLLLAEDRPEGQDSPERTYYWIAPALRRAVEREIKQHIAVLTYSRNESNYAVWLIKVSHTGWYDSLHRLLTLPAEDYKRFEYRITADQRANRYAARRREITDPVDWPVVNMRQLVAECIGPDAIIESESHPFYVNLVDGEAF